MRCRAATPTARAGRGDAEARAPGPRTERLLAAKRRFDPDHVFRAIPLPCRTRRTAR
ncbi:BBE domain-containing protein [Streptomyces odontomachi]|uniref:BBE domain-containing protein n=1 Tax=Streptomyces odontomachi TaxID=2944940 RepID=UPI0035A93E54